MPLVHVGQSTHLSQLHGRVRNFDGSGNGSYMSHHYLYFLKELICLHAHVKNKTFAEARLGWEPEGHH